MKIKELDLDKQEWLSQAERIQYDNPQFPAFLRKNCITANPIFRSTLQWHDEVEFIYVFFGSALYNVNGEIISIHAGEGIFINARQLHVIVSDNGNACNLYCVILHPVLLCSSSYIAEKFIRPIIENESIPYLHLSVNIPWQKIILEKISQIYEHKDYPDGELLTQRYFTEIWEQLYSHLDITAQTVKLPNQQLYILKNMISYIHAHYMDKVTIEQICAAGNVGKTTCISIFKKHTNRTPVTFLTEYRLQMSIQLLENTDLSITEICYETGFSNASYYAETFKKFYGLSPREFRNRQSIAIDY